MKILAEISTKDRYFTTLPLTIQSICTQVRTPDKLLIIDDGEQIDLRQIPLYKHLFSLLDRKGIKWEVIFGSRKGQHINHEVAQEIAIKDGFDAVWRVDDDEVPESRVLKELENTLFSSTYIGAVAGMVLDPMSDPVSMKDCGVLISEIDTKPNIQWATTDIEAKSKLIDVDHLYSSFLYKVGIAHYNQNLSTVAHREETLFSYEIKRSGKRLVVDPMITTWHLRNSEGGIRSKGNDASMWEHDENIFKKRINGIDFGRHNKIIVLDNGMGDHMVFKKILPEIQKKYQNIVIFCCYPEIFKEESVRTDSIQEAKYILGNIEPYNIYRKMDEWSWKSEMIDAFRKMYI